ncbi:MAG TPA: hypothetical protein VMG08_17910 [Allosphingosinicella sp.]|nr:hypothetical protein [Allosphingosinicella sp.]
MRWIRLGLAVPLCLAALPVAAQPQIGSRLEDRPGAVRAQRNDDQVTARRVMRTYAACLVRNRSRVASEISAATYGSEDQFRLIRRHLAGADDCMGASGLSMSVNPATLSGALAEVGLETRYASADLAPVTALSDEDIGRLNLTPRNGQEDLGLCVARRAPAAVRAWALTEPGSPEDNAAGRRVVPDVGPCVVQGQSLNANLVGLRAILAAGLYRALSAVRP